MKHQRIRKTREELWTEFQAENNINGCCEVWSFGGEQDQLAALVLAGIKTETASAAELYENDNEELPTAGGYSIVLDSRENAVCIIQTTHVEILPYNQVSAWNAFLEGEGDRSLAYWRKVHQSFFESEYAKIGRAFIPDIPVVCEEFRLVYLPELPIYPMQEKDKGRIAEILVYNNRMNYYPIFQDEKYSFNELTVEEVVRNFQEYIGNIDHTYIWNDGVIKGFVTIEQKEIKKLYVDSFFQGKGIGSYLIEYAIREKEAKVLWCLQKNNRAISFYQAYGFLPSGKAEYEEGTKELLIELRRITDIHNEV